MANNKRSYFTSFVDVFTVMLNTPLVEPESVTRPTAVPLKTLSEASQRASSETSRDPTFSFADVCPSSISSAAGYALCLNNLFRSQRDIV
jgi:hypothetical protein